MIGVRAIMDVSHLRTTLARQGRDLSPALRHFMRRIAGLVEENATNRLSGSGEPGSYPIPTPTGNLRGSMGSESDDSSATIFNTAEYAAAAHAGFRAYNNPKGRVIPPRPYIADGINDTDIPGELNDALARVFE